MSIRTPNHYVSRARLTLLVLALPLLASCDTALSAVVPVYEGLTIVGFNYTSKNVYYFTVKDKFGHSASGGGELPPGGGEGSFSCCYKLVGNEFTVEWDVGRTLKEIEKNIPRVKRSTNAYLTKLPNSLPNKSAYKILEIHLYPDEHVELDYTDQPFNRTRLDITEVIRWLATEKPEFAHVNRWRLGDPVSIIVGEAWKKYRYSNLDDLRQYVYFAMRINRDFDTYPAIVPIIEQTRQHPGALGARLAKMPEALITELRKAAKTPAIEVVKEDQE